MQVHINSDSTISMHNKLSDSIASYINNVLRRFEQHLTRVEVHLSGENIRKSGPLDKRCLLEARPKHHRSLVVCNDSNNIDAAFEGAADKLLRMLETTYGRLDDKYRRSEKMKARVAGLQPIALD
jgi:ribosome-associated translation inhibitor RaiA